jgi:site-specific recombinase XerD
MSPALETNESLVDKYERWMRSWDASPATIDARVGLARSRLDAWGLDGFTVEKIQNFLATPGWSRWTRATYHAHLKSLCEYLEAAGYLRESPMEDVRSVRRPRSLPRPLSDAEMALALDRAKTYRDKRVKDWIVLARRSGLRCHELAKLAGRDLTDRGLYVLGKGGKEALLPIHPEIATMAMRYPAQGYWFPSPHGEHLHAETLSAAVSRFFSSVGIQGSIHRVRHNFGTELLRSGADLRVVQELMRHSSLATTAVYTAVDSDRLADAIGRLPAA